MVVLVSVVVIGWLLLGWWWWSMRPPKPKNINRDFAWQLQALPTSPEWRRSHAARRARRQAKVTRALGSLVVLTGPIGVFTQRGLLTAALVVITVVPLAVYRMAARLTPVPASTNRRATASRPSPRWQGGPPVR
jgi:hypothetical protein